MKKIVFLLSFILSSVFILKAQDIKYQLSSHILDITKGLPAKGVEVELYKYDNNTSSWSLVDAKKTDDNGRIKNFLPYDGHSNSNNGNYRLRFMVKPYFESMKTKTFYPFIDVVFSIEGNKHYHVPITLSAFGYSTYRGS